MNPNGKLPATTGRPAASRRARRPARSLDVLHGSIAHTARRYWMYQRARIRLGNQIAAHRRNKIDEVWLVEMREALAVLEGEEKAQAKPFTLYVQAYGICDPLGVF